MALHAVFHSAVHRLACRDYTAEQIAAWAPSEVDQEAWVRRMRAIRPFVAECNGHIVAYADVQPNGHIDHFFVCALHARQGVGTTLMERIHQAAHSQGIKVLTADVSRTAQPFFERFGFVVVEYKSAVIRGVSLPNARMRKPLQDSPT